MAIQPRLGQRLALLGPFGISPRPTLLEEILPCGIRLSGELERRPAPIVIPQAHTLFTQARTELHLAHLAAIHVGSKWQERIQAGLALVRVRQHEQASA